MAAIGRASPPKQRRVNSEQGKRDEGRRRRDEKQKTGDRREKTDSRWIGMQASAKCKIVECRPRRDGRFSCSFVPHIKNPLFVRCILYIEDCWVSSEIVGHNELTTKWHELATENTENLARPKGRSQIRSTILRLCSGQESEIRNKSKSPKLKIRNKP